MADRFYSGRLRRAGVRTRREKIRIILVRPATTKVLRDGGERKNENETAKIKIARNPRRLGGLGVCETPWWLLIPRQIKFVHRPVSSFCALSCFTEFLSCVVTPKGQGSYECGRTRERIVVFTVASSRKPDVRPVEAFFTRLVKKEMIENSDRNVYVQYGLSSSDGS